MCLTKKTCQDFVWSCVNSNSNSHNSVYTYPYELPLGRATCVDEILWSIVFYFYLLLAVSWLVSGVLWTFTSVSKGVLNLLDHVSRSRSQNWQSISTLWFTMWQGPGYHVCLYWDWFSALMLCYRRTHQWVKAGWTWWTIENWPNTSTLWFTTVAWLTRWMKCWMTRQICLSTGMSHCLSCCMSVSPVTHLFPTPAFLVNACLKYDLWLSLPMLVCGVE